MVRFVKHLHPLLTGSFPCSFLHNQSSLTFPSIINRIRALLYTNVISGEIELRSTSTIELSSGDIYFLISTVESDLLSRIDSIPNDPEFIESMMEKGAVKVFQRIILLDGNELTTSITPRFLFEILFRTARFELKNRGYTIERSLSMKVPVFDSQDV